MPFAQKRITDIGIIFSPIVFLSGAISNDFNLMFIACLLLWTCNAIFGCLKPYERIVFLCFNAAFFLFLMGYSFVGFIKNWSWWNVGQSTSSEFFGIMCIYVSLAFLSLSASTSSLFLASHDRVIKQHTIHTSYMSVFQTNLRLVSLLVYLISWACSLFRGIEVIHFIKTHTYIQYYTEFTSKQPRIVNAFIEILLPSLLIFLSLRPTKLKTFFVLSSYILSTLPIFIVGQRNPTMLACLFSFLYYVIRDFVRKEGEPRWLGRKEIALILALLPILIVFLTFYTDLRNDKSIDMTKLQNPFSTFLLEQSNTSRVIVKSYDHFSEIPNYNYLWGQTYDRIRSVSIVRRMFDVPIYTQSQLALEQSHNSATHLSYAILGDRYFNGEGVGTSYLLDLFLTHRWVGIAAFSFLFGIYTIVLPKLVSKNWLLCTLVLSSLINICFTPRANALAAFQNLFAPYFWIGIGICYVGAKLITPKTFQGESKYIGRQKTKYIKYLGA